MTADKHRVLSQEILPRKSATLTSVVMNS